MAWKHLVDDMLEQGDLVRSFSHSFRSDIGYYLLTSEAELAKLEGLLILEIG